MNRSAQAVADLDEPTKLQVIQEHYNTLLRELPPGQGVTTEMFLNAARDPASPAHGLYDWNQRRNAERWLLHQTRLFMSRITTTVVTREPERTVLSTRAFTSVQDGSGQKSYVRTPTVISEADMRKQRVAALTAEINSWCERAAPYEELRPVVNAVHKALSPKKKEN